MSASNGHSKNGNGNGNPRRKAKAGNGYKQEAFLAAFAKVGVIRYAAAAVKMDRKLHNRWLEQDPSYRRKFRIAQEEAIEHLENEAITRATQGVARFKFHKGKQIMVPDPADPTGKKKIPYVEWEKSDVLLIFLLKGLRPEKYRERHEHTGPDGTPIGFQVIIE